MKHQRGVTVMGFIFTAIFACVFALLVMRIFPPMHEHYNVIAALKKLPDLNKDKQIRSVLQLKRRIKKRFFNQLDIDAVTSVKRNDLFITKAPGGYNVQVKYQRVSPFFSNIQLLFSFDDSVVVKYNGV